MKCPHCRVDFHDSPSTIDIGSDVQGEWRVIMRTCPSKSCRRLILELVNFPSPEFTKKLAEFGQLPKIKKFLIWPKSSLRSPCPVEVPKEIAEDYTEACLVLTDSPKASAALSRRCLQNLLREKAGVKHGNLSNEIEQVLDSGVLPSYLSDAIDAIRNIGNFAAHPLKSKSTGEILPVDPEEAEWNLDVLELLFDFYFVQPEVAKKKRDVLDKKLAEAGKPSMKL